MKKILFGIALMMLSSAFVAPECCAQNDAQALEKVIMGRHSVRKYKDQKVSREMLDRVIKNGLNAPSGMNRQSYELRVVDDPALLESISRACSPNRKSIFVNGTAVIFIAYDTSYDLAQVDCGLLAQNIMLSATSLGLGSCCLGIPVRQMEESEACKPYMEKLGFSEGYKYLIAIALGYPDEQPSVKPRKDSMVKYVE